MKLLLANPRGFCAGVDRAIDIVQRALDLFGAPIYVRHEVVHNKPVVEDLKAKGAIFLDDINDVPNGAILIFSAHGVSKAIQALAKEKQFKVFDATCPLVTKVHMEVARLARNHIECILIGHAGHPEVEGTMGQYEGEGIYLVETIEDVLRLQLNNPDRVALVTQTTLSVDDTQEIITALKQRFPNIQSPKKEDICYATTNRQEAVRTLAMQSDIMLVIGSETSSNSNRLKELAEKLGCKAFLLDDHTMLSRDWFVNVKTIGMTAGASAPESLVQAVIAKLKTWGVTSVDEMNGIHEDIVFALPKPLRVKVTNS